MSFSPKILFLMIVFAMFLGCNKKKPISYGDLREPAGMALVPQNGQSKIFLSDTRLDGLKIYVPDNEISKGNFVESRAQYYPYLIPAGKSPNKVIYDNISNKIFVLSPQDNSIIKIHPDTHKKEGSFSFLHPQRITDFEMIESSDNSYLLAAGYSESHGFVHIENLQSSQGYEAELSQVPYRLFRFRDRAGVITHQQSNSLIQIFEFINDTFSITSSITIEGIIEDVMYYEPLQRLYYLRSDLPSVGVVKVIRDPLFLQDIQLKEQKTIVANIYNLEKAQKYPYLLYLPSRPTHIQAIDAHTNAQTKKTGAVGIVATYSGSLYAVHLEKLSLLETYHLDGNLPSERVNIQNVIFPQTDITSVQPIPLCEDEHCTDYQMLQPPESAGLWSVIYEPNFPALGQKALACINSCSSTITDIPYSDWMIRDYNISNFDDFMVKQGDTLTITTTPKKPGCSQQFTVNETYLNIVSLTPQLASAASEISASECYPVFVTYIIRPQKTFLLIDNNRHVTGRYEWLDIQKPIIISSSWFSFTLKNEGDFLLPRGTSWQFQVSSNYRPVVVNSSAAKNWVVPSPSQMLFDEKMKRLFVLYTGTPSLLEIDLSQTMVDANMNAYR